MNNAIAEENRIRYEEEKEATRAMVVMSLWLALPFILAFFY